MTFGGGFTLESIDNMRNIDYLMLLKCIDAHNKRMQREAESANAGSGGGGSTFIDKEAIRRSYPS